MNKTLRSVGPFGLLALLLSGCAVIAPPPPTVPVSENAAVIALVGNAQADADAGRFPNAVAALERALRLEPRNPRLWQEFARVRLKEGDYAQAESLAARSNSWAGGDNDLRAENWRLIGEARTARGDEAGARAALERAKQFGR
jgi:tetratricopeptide (TPR) repeat protein